MGLQPLTRGLDNMQSKLIHKQGRKSITDELESRKFLNNSPDLIKKYITRHLTDEMTHTDIVTKSEQLQAANVVANAEHTKPWYYRELSRYTNATRTRSSYTARQPRPDKSQQPQNCPAITGARLIASAGTQGSDWDEIHTP